ncbi:MAG: phosphoribosyl-ATP diphosphatase [Gammaproteobacteria bacterium]|jgi:phosphoribosyl-ATP pyrophosphohydrolase|nr:phosphoribosyl-ATP diphosphatase [Gammaproteobacteria bacterium]MDP6733872.1 phosphoribosyl-ATP diphosphatase [Gammaproteobacteria bacterium]|tara:strand:+ start:1002 stop:1337 length:336 start_codon:yes stop_codon:yes gene_type:complete
MSDILRELASVLEQRKSASAESSYVASLHEQGLSKILQKVEEEALETVEAANECATGSGEGKNAVIHETADLWFHTMVMLSHLELGPDQVLEELEKRFNISGLQEKASRQN